jgi:6-pyruvoyl-tetrahydropterin synthase
MGTKGGEAMTDKTTGGPAFPCVNHYGHKLTGMTLRDYLAAKALDTILGQYDLSFFNDDKREKEEDTFALVVARYAYAMADAMLKAREQ